VWLYHELRFLYGDVIPPLEVTTFSDVSSFRAHKPQWLLDLNPNGKVPTFVHGDVVLFESGAICSYLLEAFDRDRLLLPSVQINAQAFASYHLFLCWCASTLDNLTATSSPISIVLSSQEAAAARPMDQLQANKKYFDEVAAPFISTQIQKSGGPFLCGAEFSAVDVIVGYSVLIAGEKMQPSWLDEAKHPRLCEYYSAFRGRPALARALE